MLQLMLRNVEAWEVSAEIRKTKPQRMREKRGREEALRTQHSGVLPRTQSQLSEMRKEQEESKKLNKEV